VPGESLAREVYDLHLEAPLDVAELPFEARPPHTGRPGASFVGDVSAHPHLDSPRAPHYPMRPLAGITQW
jgi:hypothetical protein